MGKLVSFVLLFVVLDNSCAEAQIPDKPDPAMLVHAKTQLKEAESNLDAALAKIEYTDPGDSGQDRPHLVSQIAWEKNCQPEQYKGKLHDALVVDPAKRTEQQTKLVRNFYLCNVHLESKKPLWLLYQRVKWLDSFVNAFENGGYHQEHAEEFPRKAQSYWFG